MSLTFFAPNLDLSIQLARAYNVDPIPLLIDAEIDPAITSDYNARIPTDKVLGFYQKIAEVIPNPNFGLDAGQFWHPTQMGALGYAWMTSSTLRSAFGRLVRFSRSVLGVVDVTIEELDNSLSLVFDFSNEYDVPAFQLDGHRSVMLAMIQCNAGHDFHPLSVSFQSCRT